MDNDMITIGSRYYRIYITLIELLIDRGYSVPNQELEISKDSFLMRFFINDCKMETILASHAIDNTDIFVFFFPQNKISIRDVKNVVMRMNEKSVSKSLLVCEYSISNNVKQMISEIGSTLSIEVFFSNELLFNVTKHEYVPIHILLQPEEKLAVMNQYHIKEHQLPKLLSNDPIVRYYGFKKGQFIKIIRKSETSGSYILYRVVC